MEKKGQTTLFIVLGILLVAIVILYLVLVRQDIIPPLLAPTDAATDMAAVETHVKGCLEDVGGTYVTLIGLQGGYLSPAPDTYRLYNDSAVSYLCWNQEGVATCTNRLLTLSHIEEELTDAIDQELSTCINVKDISSDADIAKEWELAVAIRQNSVDLTLDYPVTIDKGKGDIASEDTFSASVDAPLGDLYQVSQDIVNDHALYGDFDHLLYVLSKVGRYSVYKNSPYPDVVYQVRLLQDDYVFQFAIQGAQGEPA